MLIFKSFSWMSWVLLHCASVPWIVKTDDDFLVNPFQLEKYFQNQSIVSQRNLTYHCNLCNYGKVFRNESSKWWETKSPEIWHFMNSSHLYKNRSPLVILKIKSFVFGFRYISEKEYPGKFYPKYCPGGGIILNPAIAKKSLSAFQKNSSYIWIDDVFLIGKS